MTASRVTAGTLDGLDAWSGEALGVFTHGTAVALNPLDAPASPDWPPLLAYLKDFYGADAFDWSAEVVYYRLDPHWMTVFAADPAHVE